MANTLIKHGHTKHRLVSPEYRTWSAMRRRCRNTRAIDYKYYGARGILVCERWDKFENFLSDMGPKPYGLTLDRINTNGNYEPSNCKWATRLEQVCNRRPLPKRGILVRTLGAIDRVRDLKTHGYSNAQIATHIGFSRQRIRQLHP